MSDYVAALATVVAVYVMLRAERKDMAKISDVTRVEARIDGLETKMSARIDGLETKMSARIDALDTKMTARLDTVVLELGKAFGRPTG